MAKHGNKGSVVTKPGRARVLGVPFYEEYDQVKAAAEEARMKFGPFVREVVRQRLGLKSLLDPAAAPIAKPAK